MMGSTCVHKFAQSLIGSWTIRRARDPESSRSRDPEARELEILRSSASSPLASWNWKMLLGQGLFLVLQVLSGEQGTSWKTTWVRNDFSGIQRDQLLQRVQVRWQPRTYGTSSRAVKHSSPGDLVHTHISQNSCWVGDMRIRLFLGHPMGCRQMYGHTLA